MRRTRWPISARAAPRLTAVVVLPTPPFCIATAIVRAKSAPSLTEAGRDRPSGRPHEALPLSLAAVFVIPLIAAVVGVSFAVVVGRQYLVRRKPYQAIWALALAMFAAAAAFETIGQLAGWSDATYKGYYLFGGLLNVGWLGIGSLVILATPRVGRAAVIVMVVISLISVVAVLAAHTIHAVLKAQVPAPRAGDRQ